MIEFILADAHIREILLVGKKKSEQEEDEIYFNQVVNGQADNAIVNYFHVSGEEASPLVNVTRRFADEVIPSLYLVILQFFNNSFKSIRFKNLYLFPDLEIIEIATGIGQIIQFVHPQLGFLDLFGLVFYPHY